MRVGYGKELLEISWLQLQRVDKLDLCLGLPALTAKSSQRAVTELQQIQISCLHVKQ